MTKTKQKAEQQDATLVVRIPQRLRAEMDRVKARVGMPYAEQVRRALEQYTRLLALSADALALERLDESVLLTVTRKRPQTRKARKATGGAR